MFPPRSAWVLSKVTVLLCFEIAVRDLTACSAILFIAASPLHTFIMGRQAPSAEEMLATASQNNYKPGAHKALDRKRHRGKHREKTKKNQDGTLRRYVV
jgi:hypothetical protein